MPSWKETVTRRTSKPFAPQSTLLPQPKDRIRSAPDTNPIPSLIVTCHKCLATLEYNLKCGRCGVHVVKSTALSPHGQVGLLVVRRFFRSKTPLNHLTDKVQDRHKVYSSDAIGELWKTIRWTPPKKKEKNSKTDVFNIFGVQFFSHGLFSWTFFHSVQQVYELFLFESFLEGSFPARNHQV